MSAQTADAGRTALDNGRIFRAGGKLYETARGDGNGGLLRAGYYFNTTDERYGPFDSEAQAALVRSILNSRPRLCTAELIGGEFAALNALRRKGHIAKSGLYLTPEGIAALAAAKGAGR